MFVPIATTTIAGVLLAIRCACANCAVRLVKAVARTQQRYETLLYRRDDDDPRP